MNLYRFCTPSNKSSVQIDVPSLRLWNSNLMHIWILCAVCVCVCSDWGFFCQHFSLWNDTMGNWDSNLNDDNDRVRYGVYQFTARVFERIFLSMDFCGHMTWNRDCIQPWPKSLHYLQCDASLNGCAMAQQLLLLLLLLQSLHALYHSYHLDEILWNKKYSSRYDFGVCARVVVSFVVTN